MFETIRERIPFQAQYATKRIVPATQTARTAAMAGNPRNVKVIRFHIFSCINIRGIAIPKMTRNIHV
jgi:hypothetical protein